MILNNNKFIVYLTFILLLLGSSVFAQRPSVSATIEPSEIQVGEQAVITLDIKAPKGRQIQYPQFNYRDPLIKGIEVIQQLKADTTIEHEVMSIKQKYIVTSFDSALYNIPFIPIIDLSTKDTIKSKNLGLKVTFPALSDSTLNYLELMNSQQTDSINFDALQLADITDVQNPPFVWQDLLEYIWLGLLIALIILLLVLGIFFVTRKKKKGYFFTPVVKKAPHEVALEALNKIKSNKLWQHGREKEYYTELTDVLRTYVEKRFLINALEKTSDEILESLSYIAESDSAKENLQQILKLADLVKFAKYKPLIDENDLTLMNAYLFVNQTKIEEKPEEKEEEGVNTSQTNS